MNIFYIEENDIILDINTEKITENYKEIKGENIDEIISILSKEKLSYDTDIQSKLEEIFENREQIEISKHYEKLPKPTSIAIREWLDDEIYFRKTDK